MNVRPISIRSDHITQKGTIIRLHTEDKYGCFPMHINSKTSFFTKMEFDSSADLFLPTIIPRPAPNSTQPPTSG